MTPKTPPWRSKQSNRINLWQHTSANKFAKQTHVSNNFLRCKDLHEPGTTNSPHAPTSVSIKLIADAKKRPATNRNRMPVRMFATTRCVTSHRTEPNSRAFATISKLSRCIIHVSMIAQRTRSRVPLKREISLLHLSIDDSCQDYRLSWQKRRERKGITAAASVICKRTRDHRWQFFDCEWRVSRRGWKASEEVAPLDVFLNAWNARAAASGSSARFTTSVFATF